MHDPHTKTAYSLKPSPTHAPEDKPNLHPMEDPTVQPLKPKGDCDPMGTPGWSRLLAGPVTPWREELRLEQACWQDL